MPRRKSVTGRKIGNSSEESIRLGITLIRNGVSIRQAAKDVKVPFSTLKRYFFKTKNAASLEGQRLQPNYSVNKVFTATQEKELKDYINYCSSLFYGLTSKECRQLAYQCAQINKIKMPASWQKNEMAGKDWLISFKRRHNLTTRRPEPCSLARATSFNQTNVTVFFDNLENLIKRNPAFADGTRIFNLDETSTTTVQKPQKVVAPKGRKCVGKVTSGERGTLVTTCCIISSSGNALPPVVVFPRKNFKEHMIKNTPPGTLGLATPTGWMNSTIFPAVMKHFIKHANASKDNPCILIMDNHESHFCLEALNMAKDAGVHILTLHPHTSNKLQPLDVGIYGPFKVYYNAAIDSWLMRHPGKPITIYDLGEIIGIAFQKAMTPLNITKSFAKCGIHPFDRLIFTDDDYLPSSVTDRPCPDCAPREEGFSYTAPFAPENQSNKTSSNEIPGTLFPQTQSNELETDQITELSSEYITMLHEMIRTTKDMAVLSTNSCLRESTGAKSDTDLNIADPLNLDETTITANNTPATLKFQVLQVISRLLPKSPVNFSNSSERPQKLDQELQASEIEAPSVETCPVTPQRVPLSNITQDSARPSITPASSTDSFLSPFAFRNPIKAGPRNTNKKRRKAGRSMIATDTPEKLIIEKEKSAMQQKKEATKKKTIRKVLQSDEEEEKQEGRVAKKKKTVRKILQNDEEEENRVPKKKKTIQKVLTDEKEQDRVVKENKNIREVVTSDEEEEEYKEILKLTDSEEYSDEADSNQDDTDPEMFVLTENHLRKPLPRPAREGEYIIAQFVTKRLRLLYIGKVLEGRNSDLEYYVSFLRHKPRTERFHIPDKPDLSIVKENDIKYILPKPTMVGTSSRPMYCFPLDLSSLKLR